MIDTLQKQFLIFLRNIKLLVLGKLSDKDAYNESVSIWPSAVSVSHPCKKLYGTSILFYSPCMSPWIIVRCTPFLNSEQLRSIATVQLFKSIHGHPRRSRDKLQKPSSHLVTE